MATEHRIKRELKLLAIKGEKLLTVLKGPQFVFLLRPSCVENPLVCVIQNNPKISGRDTLVLQRHGSNGLRHILIK